MQVQNLPFSTSSYEQFQAAEFSRLPSASEQLKAGDTKSADSQHSPELKEAFQSFVGEAFYGLLLKEMRKTVGKPAYFHGGRAEEAFRGQLDQVISEKLAKSENNALADSLFELQFATRR